MRLYNSLSRKKESFEPKPGQRVNLFVCGPTVYDFSHLGHARTYLAYDALVKFLRKRLKWDIFYLQNITNIDDKIINRAEEKNEDPSTLAQRFEDLHYKDMEALDIDSVDKYARATDYIPEIISQVERLIKKGNAYKIDADGYYFNISTFDDYGKLSGRTVSDAEDAITRIDESVNKKNKGDFALWKFSREGEPGWDSPLGFGRPGWHIEDTAITEKHFGFTYDFHGGAIDLKFPHHEAEIAQMESLSGIKPMVKIWVHSGLLTIEGERMGKSLDNFVTIAAFLKKESSHTLRMFVFSSLYRSPVDYTDNAIKEAKIKVERLTAFYRKLKGVKEIASAFPWQDFTNSFWKDLENDFNTPKAFSRLFELMNEANKYIDSHTLSRKDALSLLDFIDELNDIFNIIPDNKEEENIPQEIKKLAQDREDARKRAEFHRADEVREEIKSKGYTVEDTPDGPRVYKS